MRCDLCRSVPADRLLGGWPLCARCMEFATNTYPCGTLGYLLIGLPTTTTASPSHRELEEQSRGRGDSLEPGTPCINPT